MRTIEQNIIGAINKAIVTKKNSTLSMRDTVIFNGKNKIIYKLWDNSVFSVSLDKKEICFTCHGWFSVTTKSRLNALLRAFASGYIYQKDCQFYYKSDKQDMMISGTACYNIENGELKEITQTEFYY